MAMQQIGQEAPNYIRPNDAGPKIDFYKQINEFTKNLSKAQLLLLRDYLNRLSNEPKHQSNLSKRETEVLILLSNGYSRRNIGQSLGISANTAARHIANIYQKLGVSCVAEATHYALSHHIIS